MFFLSSLVNHLLFSSGWCRVFLLFYHAIFYLQNVEHQFSSVQSLSRVQYSFVTPWTAAHQTSLSITISLSLLKLGSTESLVPSTHLIFCCPLLLLLSVFPSLRVFPTSQVFTPDGQNIGASASASVLPVNIQDWFPLGWTGWISLQAKGLSRVFSSTTIWKTLSISRLFIFC